MHTVKPSPKLPPIAPPSNLTAQCVIDKPPTDLTTPTLVKAWTSQTINDGDCNKKVTGLKEWIDNTLKELEATYGK